MPGPGLGLGLGLGTQVFGGGAGPPPGTDLIELEDDSGQIELENGLGAIQLEDVGPIVSSVLNNPGINWQVNDTFFLASYSGDATFIVDSVSIAPTSYALTDFVPDTFGVTVTNVNQGTKTFTASIDIRPNLIAGLLFEIQGSTGNDAVYTVASFALNGSETDIVVVEAIPDPTVDGFVTSAGVLSINGDHVAELTDGLVFITGNSGGLNGSQHYQTGVTDFNFGASGKTRLFLTMASLQPANPTDGNVLLLHQATVVTYTMTDPGTVYATFDGVIATGGGSSAGTGLTLDIVV